ncbi:MBG domain-containing protein [Flavobacterium sp. K5-23]|uniref:MBG domain-containing protein n=1 Tax=Flavobacterium sp. K5-23 TaxID=2746225 RepID=UPI002010B811|nr:MBG domain-containing protein [Flavobacterium sp. K5-23]UQD56477.1 T9SS type A sorting domain-containing protein [Flavobacterium sp. K5-23]
MVYIIFSFGIKQYTLTVGNNLNLTSSDADNKIAEISVDDSGTIITNNLNLSTGTNGTTHLNLSGVNSRLTVSGAINITGTKNTNTFSTTSIVEYNGATQNVVKFNSIYANVALSGSGVKTFAATLAINGRLTINSGVKAKLNAFSSTANTLTLGGVSMPAGTYGGTDSGATNIITDYFEAGLGILTVANGPAKVNQTITFTNPGTKTYGDAPFSVSATATSGLAISFSIVSGPATISGNTITITGAGSVVVRAAQSGNASYNAAPNVDQSFTVNKATPTISVTGTQTFTYNGLAQGPATISYNGDGSTSLLYTNTNGTAYSSATAPTNAGSYQVVASATAGVNYNVAVTSAHTFTISKAATETVVTINDAPFTYTGSVIEPATVSLTGANLSLTPTASYLNNVAAGVNTASASYTYAESANHLGSTQTVIFTIGKATATLTLTNLTGHTYDATSKSATASITPSGVTGITVTGSGTDAGSYPVSASLTNANYQAEAVTGSIEIGKATATIAIVDYSADYDTFTHTASGTATGVNSTDLSSGLSFATSHTNVPGGSTNWSFAGGTNYNNANGTANVTIGKATATLVLGNLTGHTYDATSKSATASITPVGVTGVTVSGSGMNAGDYPASASLDNANYTATTVNGSLEIGKATATIAIVDYSADYDTFAHTASGTATGVNSTDLSSGLSFTTSHTNVPGGSTNWSFAGGTNYNNANGTANVTIGKATATLVLGNLTGHTYDATSKSATASITPVGVTGVTVTGSGTDAGDYPASASLDNANYTATTVNGSIEIGKATATIAIVDYSADYDTFAHTASGTATGVNSTDLSSGLSFATSHTNVPGGSTNWSFAGGTNYNNANGTANVTIGKATATLVLGNLTGHTYDATSKSATASITPVGVTGVTVTGSGTDAGDYPASASLDNANYTATTVNGSLEIGKATATIAIVDYSADYDTFAHTASGTATGVNSTDLSSGLSFATSHTNVPGGSTNWSFAGGTNYNNANGTANVTIGKATATLVLGNLTGHTYDATSKSATASITPVGVTGVTVTGSGTDAGDYPASASLDNANYTATTVNGSLEIGKATATIAIVDYSADYDTFAHTASGTATGVNSTDLSSGLSFATSHTNVPGGSTNWSFAGGTNYNNANGTANVTIGKATATLVLGNLTGHTYDATSKSATASITPVGVTGVTVSGSGMNAGDYPASASLDNANYTATTVNGSLEIGKATATIAIVDYSADYDTFAHTASGTATGVNSTDLSSGLSFTTSHTNVPGGSTSWSFAGGTNYNNALGTAAIVIGKKDITGSFSAENKMYDATTNAVVTTNSRALVGVIGADVVSLEGGTATFNNKHVGDGKAVALEGATITGAQAANYNLTSVATTTSVISVRLISITAQQDTKVYDGTTSSSVLPLRDALQGVGTSADTYSNIASQTTDNKHVGTSKELSANVATINDGNNGYNYSITYVTNNTGVITKKNVRVTALAYSKVYDGNMISSRKPACDPLAPGDVETTVIKQDYMDALVGTGKVLVPSGLVINDGNNMGGNYTIEYITKLEGTITPASTTTTLITSAASVRFMDMFTMTARVVPNHTATALTGAVKFTIGSFEITATAHPVPGATDGMLEATVITQLPSTIGVGDYIVGAVFTSTNENYSGSTSATKPLTVLQKNVDPIDADGFYTGQVFAWTTSVTSNSGTVMLAAAIKDNNVPGGDVRGARITFAYVNGMSITPIPGAQNLPVGLIDINDGSIGVASAIVQMSIGNADANEFRIAVIVSGGYKNDPYAARSQTQVSISRPLPGGFIMGAGNVRNADINVTTGAGPTASTSYATSGLIKGEANTLTRFSFDVKYNKSLKNPQGKAKIYFTSNYNRFGILDGENHYYEIASNAIAGLNLQNVNATFTSKANLNEILKDGTSVAIEGGASFELKMRDGGITTSSPIDEIGITLYRKAGGIWYSNSFNATNATTVNKLIFNGEINVVGGGGSLVAKQATVKNETIKEPLAVVASEIKVIAYPNPSFNQFTLAIEGGSGEKVEVQVYDLLGRLVKHIEKSNDQAIQFGEDLQSGTYITIISQGTNRKTVRLIKQ